jgi:hypothetical protein
MNPRSITARPSLLAIAALAIAIAGTGTGTAQAAALRWSGLKLVDRTRPFGNPAAITGVSCPNASFCLAVGSQGTIVTATGTGTPRVVRNGVDSFATLRGVSCPTTSLCFAIESSSVLASKNPRAAKPTFRKVSLKVGVGVLEAIDCPTSSLCVALASTGAVWTSSRPTGSASAWKPTTLASGARFLEAVGCAPGGRLCVASLGGVGGSSPQLATTTAPTAGSAAWTVAPAPSIDPATAISCPSTALCVGVSPDEVLSSANPAAGGSSWTATAVVDPTQAALLGIGCGAASPASCVAAVSDGSVVVGSGAAAAPSWTRSAVLDSEGFGTSNVNEIGCLRVSTANCLVPSRGGGVARVLAPQPPAAASATVAGAGGLTAISSLACPSASLCVGVDNAGAVLRTTRPTGPGSGWRRTVQPAAAASGPEGLTGPTGLNSVSCPTTRFCAAVGNQDTLLTSTTPAAAALWKVTKLPFTIEEGSGATVLDNLGAVSCASNALCVSTGSANQLFVSTRPAGGPSAWRAFSLGAFNNDVFTTVACPRTTLCIAGDNVNGRLAVSTTPSRSWRLITLFRGGVHAPAITAVACAPSGLCLVGTATGALYRSTHPARGVGTFRRFKLSRRAIVGLACRSARLCVAIDRLGRAWSSTSPTGGASTWHVKALDFHDWPTTGRRLSAVACASRAVCVIGDGGGRVYSGR